MVKLNLGLVQQWDNYLQLYESTETVWGMLEQKAQALGNRSEWTKRIVLTNKLSFSILIFVTF